MSDNNDSPNFPLSQLERRARSHAILSAIGFLILLPVGVLVARYSRTLRYKQVSELSEGKKHLLTSLSLTLLWNQSRWFWAHSTIQLVVSAPVILLGWALGYKTAMEFEGGHYNDPHKKVGLVLLVLYILQILLGVLVHYVKLPSLFRGYRPPHSYIHILLGLCILALAQWQVWPFHFAHC